MRVEPAAWSRRRWPFIVLAFVVFFYCLGALYDERKDRSVLFWKSLPVSDRETVLSKAASALVGRAADRHRRRDRHDVRLRAADQPGRAAARPATRSRCCWGPGNPLEGGRHAGRRDPGVRAVGAADRRLADAVLGLGAQQAVPVGGGDPRVRRHLRELVRRDERASTCDTGWFWKNIVARGC